MSNTIMSAKNSFQDGLIMDVSPENTPATALSSALNATLVTLNGNEMSLLNDMGNARVETAYLPEGFVPVGACEYGDIIYIASYNPLTGKSLIGSFPSPERNISTEELTKIRLILYSNEFTKGDLVIANSTKKILFDSKKLNPGDKFIVYCVNNITNQRYITDIGNTSKKPGTFPKLLRLRIASIDESLKITYLDDSIKWYGSGNSTYYIPQASGSSAADLDEYRTVTSSEYSIFQPKNSGLLALVAELERITGFNCAYSIRSVGVNNLLKYDVYLHVSWDTPNYDINPKSIDIEPVGGWNINNGSINTRNNTIELYRHYEPEEIGNNFKSYRATCYEVISENYKVKYGNIIKIAPKLNNNNFERYSYRVKYNTNDTSEGVIQDIPDTMANNFFKKDITLKVFTVTFNNTESSNNEIFFTDLSKSKIILKVTPNMPYGLLPDLTKEITVDFSMVGRETVELTDWRYYNSGELTTLTYGLNAGFANNKKVDRVEIEFYDNCGLVARFIDRNKESYLGVFTEQFLFNGNNTNYKLTTVDSADNPIKHPGEEVSSEKIEEADYVLYNNKYYKNDAGTLYPDFLYKCLIKVYYGVVDEFGDLINEEDPICFTRWYWTSALLNNYYFNIRDFNNIESIPVTSVFNYELKSNSNYALRESLYYNENMSPDSDFKDEGVLKTEEILSKTLGATVYHIGLLEDLPLPNIDLNITQIGLEQGSGLALVIDDKEEYKLNFVAHVGLSDFKIEHSSYEYVSQNGVPGSPSLIPEVDNDINNSSGKYNKSVGKEFYKQVLNNETSGTITNDIWQPNSTLEWYKDTFKLSLNNNWNSDNNLFHTESGEPIEVKDYKNTTCNNKIDLILQGIAFKKAQYSGYKVNTKQYRQFKSLLEYMIDTGVLDYSSSLGFYFSWVYFFVVGTNKLDGTAIQRYPSSGFNGYGGPEPIAISETSDLDRGTISNKGSRILNILNLTVIPFPLALISYALGNDNIGFTFTHSKFNTGISTSFRPKNLKDPDTDNETDYTDYFQNQYLTVLYDKSEEDSDDISAYKLNNKANGQYLLQLLALLSPDDGMTLLNDFAFGNSSGQSINSGSSGYNLATLCANICSNIYYADPELTLNELVKLYDNFSTLKYLDSWKCKIHIKVEKTDDNSDLDLLTFLKYPFITLSSYITEIDKHIAGLNIKDSAKTIKLIWNSSLLTINFEYKLPSSQKLENLYIQSTDIKNQVEDWFGNKRPINIDSYNLLYYFDKNYKFKLLDSDFLYMALSKTSFNPTNKRFNLGSNQNLEWKYNPYLSSMILYNSNTIISKNREHTSPTYLLIGRNKEWSYNNNISGDSSNYDMTISNFGINYTFSNYPGRLHLEQQK